MGARMQPSWDFESQIEREEIDQIRRKLELYPCKTPELQRIGLRFYEHEAAPTTSSARLARRQRFKFAELTIESGSKNALSGRMVSQLSERLDELERWLQLDDQEAQLAEEADSSFGGHALLVRGARGTFSSGSDLSGVRATASHLSGLELARLMQYNCARLERLPLISVAHLQGYAVGGGAELAMAADFRIISGKLAPLLGARCGKKGGGARFERE